MDLINPDDVSTSGINPQALPSLAIDLCLKLDDPKTIASAYNLTVGEMTKLVRSNDTLRTLILATRAEMKADGDAGTGLQLRAKLMTSLMIPKMVQIVNSDHEDAANKVRAFKVVSDLTGSTGRGAKDQSNTTVATKIEFNLHPSLAGAVKPIVHEQT